MKQPHLTRGLSTETFFGEETWAYVLVLEVDDDAVTIDDFFGVGNLGVT